LKRSDIRLYIARSTDGYIATADGSVEWLSPWEKADHGYTAFIEEIGTVVFGRATWDQAAGFEGSPHLGRTTHILTSRPLDDAAPHATGWDDIDALVDHLHEPSEKDVWVVGGAATIRAFLDYGVVDRMELFQIPVLLGDGIPLFEPSHRADRLALIDTEAYANGVVRTSYRVG
jgi:dihydrofolate reductase